MTLRSLARLTATLLLTTAPLPRPRPNTTNGIMGVPSSQKASRLQVF